MAHTTRASLLFPSPGVYITSAQLCNPTWYQAPVAFVLQQVVNYVQHIAAQDIWPASQQLQVKWHHAIGSYITLQWPLLLNNAELQSV